MTLLSIIQNVCGEMGVPAPSTVETTTDKRAVTFKALARREQVELARKYDWPCLIVEYTFATAANQAMYRLPADVDKVFRDTVYNQDEWCRARGALTPAEWRFMVANNNGLARQYFRLRQQIYVNILANSAFDSEDGLTLAGWTVESGTALSGGLFGNRLTWNEALETIEAGVTYRFTCDETDAVDGELYLSIAGKPQVLCDRVGGQYVCDYAVPSVDNQTVYITDGAFLNIRIDNAVCYNPADIAKKAIQLTQTPTLVETLVLEYKTLNTAFGSDYAAKAVMELNDDTTRLDEALIELGVKWRWLKSRGLDYGEEFRTYTDAVDLKYAQDIALPSVDLAPRRCAADQAPMTDGYVPDRGYGP